MWDTAPEQIRSLLDRYDIVHPFTVVYMDVDQALKATQNDWLKYLEVARDLVNTIHCVATHLNPVFNTPPEALTVDDLKRTHLIARSLKDGASSLALTQMSRAMANIETVLALTLSADETTKANGKNLYNYALNSFHAFCFSVEVLTNIVENESPMDEVRDMVARLARAPIPR